MPTCYCPSCLNTFGGMPPRCPNLGCGQDRPAAGWGRILEPGELIDRHYRVERVLALGGAGLTYLCRGVDGNGRPVPPDLAVKVLFAERASGAYLRRLANEAQVLQDLDHDHIVRCRGFVQRSGQAPYLVTQFEAGGSLLQHVQRAGPLPAPVAAGVLAQVLAGLAASHAAGVVHRDLKPANVLLHTACARDQTPWVRVADFGIAKVSAPLGAGLTQAGAFVGTPEYAAPEQYEGLPPMPATDVFAAGGLLFFLVTGEPPLRLKVRGDPLACFEQLLELLPPQLPAGALAPAARACLQDVLDHVSIARPEERWTIPQVQARIAALALPAVRPAGEAAPSTAASAGPGAEPTLLDVAQPRPAASVPRPAAVPRAEDATLLDPLPAAPAPPAAVPPPAPDLTLEDLFARPRPGAREVEPTLPHAPIAAPPAPALPAPPPLAADPGRWEPSAPARPPAALPAAPEALLRALGSVAGVDRAPLLAALAAQPRAEVSRALRTWRPGLDAALGCGTALAACALGGQDMASIARNLLRAAEPDVRCCAAEALGALAQGSLLTALARVLEDPDARVRAAATRAVGEACARTGDQALGQNWLRRLAHDTDERVRRARAAAMDRLGG